MSIEMSSSFLMQCAVLFPLVYGLIQMSCVAYLPTTLTVYWRLKRITLFVGIFSLSILIGVLISFWRGALPQTFQILHFQFVVTSLGIGFWSAKTLMVFLAEWFSMRYLFQEPGMGKFFFVISLFSFSLNLVFLSDSFTPFTLGWELMGLASVLLIAFFDQRRVAVERSFLTFLFYKLGDFFLLAALLYLANMMAVDSFSDFATVAGLHGGSLLLCLFILAAFVKAGLLPFSFWLPRAMEGPTPSSALFYGALSSHASIFLLLRISHNFGGMSGIPFLLIVFIGTLTALFAYLMAMTRADVKSQIVYSTLCQISVIFIEVAFGLEKLAFVHCILHMFLRFFQFLIAPSAIYLAHEKDFLRSESLKSSVTPTKFRQRFLHWIWWLSLHEFGLKIFWRQIVLEPLLFIGQSLKKNQRLIHYGALQLSRYVFFLLPRNPKKKDWVRYFIFLMIILIPVLTRSYVTVSFLGVVVCQAMALGFSLMSIEEKRLSTAFFNLIFSGTFLILSYYYSTHPEHVHIFYAHLITSALGFSVLGGLFIFFRNAFDLPDGHDFFGLNHVSPFLSVIFGLLILFIIGFPGFSTYFSFELLSADLSALSAFATISGLAILNLNAYLWFNIYAKLFWGRGDLSPHGVFSN